MLYTFNNSDKNEFFKLERIHEILNKFTSNFVYANTKNSPPYIECQYHALSILRKIGIPPAIKISLLDYISSRNNKYGGFCDHPNQHSTIFATYYGLSSLKYLNNIENGDFDSTIEFISLHQKEDGGFNSLDRNYGTLLHSYWALSSLHILESKKSINTNNLISFIEKCWHKNIGYSIYPNTFASMEATFYAISILSILNFNFSKSFYNSLIDWILKIQSSTSGKFPDFMGAQPTWSATLYTIYIAKSLEIIDKINISTIYESISQDDPETLWKTFCLYHIDNMLS